MTFMGSFRRAFGAIGALTLSVAAMVLLTSGVASAEDEITVGLPVWFVADGPVDFAVDGAGNPMFAVVHDSPAGGDQLYYVRCDDPQCLNETPVLIDVATQMRDVKLVLNSSGNPVIVWAEFRDLITNQTQIRLTSCSNVQCSGTLSSNVVGQTYAPTGTQHNSSARNDLHVDLAPNDNVYVFFKESDLLNSLQQITYVHCSNPTCAAAIEPEIVIATGSGATVGGVAAGLFNAPLLFFEQDGAANPVYMRCVNTGCTSLGPLVTLTGTTGIGFTRGVMDGGNGAPAILFTTPNGSFMARCSNEQCNSNTLVAVSPGGSMIEIEVDSNGFPVLASSAGVQRCYSTDCTVIGDFELLSTSLDMGMDLDGNDLPQFGFEDASDLKLIRCNDPACRAPMDIHVDHTATGNNDGTSWNDAFTDVQDGLAAALFGDTVMIAEGVYTPHASDRHVSFEIPTGVTVQGGYATGGFAGPNNETFPVVLSGDLLGNDVGEVTTINPSRSENSIHVVTAGPTVVGARLDEITIADGNANLAFPDDVAGGLDTDDAGIELTDVTVTRNSAIFVGGVRIRAATATATIRDSVIRDNMSAFHAGGIQIGGGGDTNLYTTVIRDNRAGTAGGGISFVNADTDVRNVSIINNRANGNGGGVRVWNGGFPTILNSLIADNAAQGSGGAIVTESSTKLSLTNTTVANNTAKVNAGAALINGLSVNFVNSIVWGNSPTSPFAGSGTADGTDSNIEGGLTGSGNMNVDPFFVYPDGGNYRLAVGSPVVDEGDTLNVPTDDVDVDEDLDTSEFAPDLDLNDRIIFPGAVDMGAYEGEACDNLYVDDFGDDSSGLSWANAKHELRDAIPLANACTESPGIIFIAEGTYTPHATSTTESFEIPDGWTLIGGFKSGGSVVPDNDLFPVVLSGDLLGNDTGFPTNTNSTRNDNSRVVVEVPGFKTGRIEHLTVSGGNPSTPFTEAAVYAGTLASLHAERVIIEDNGFATHSALGSQGGNLTVVDSVIRDNHGSFIIKPGRETTLINNLVVGNDGTVMASQFGDSATLVNNTIIANDGPFGQVLGGSVEVYGSLIVSNDATIVANVGNGGYLSVLSSTVAQNGSTVAGLSVDGSSELVIRNSILRNDGPGAEIDADPGATVSVEYSNIAGGFTGAGNIDAEPWFENPAANNFRLIPSLSPSINAGNNTFVASDLYDLDGNDDKNEYAPDLDLDDRVQETTVDQGAYETEPCVGVCRSPLDLYVDESASGSNSGVDWVDAFNELTSALAIIVPGDTIHIAEGTYLPTDNLDRAVSFEITEDIEIIGGYPSGGAASPDASQYETVLSGDLSDNDAGILPTDNSRSDNTFTVVEASGVTVTLSGLTIADGNASKPAPNNVAGGIDTDSSHVTLEQVTLRDNSASIVGGARFIAIGGSGSTTIIDSVVSGNHSDAWAGGVQVSGMDPVTVIGTTFSDNNADDEGGGLSIVNSNPTIINSVFSGNTASTGGAMWLWNGAHTNVQNALVIDNTTTDGGGGVRVDDTSTAAFTNVTFTGNDAGSGQGSNGVAVLNQSTGEVTIRNSIVYANVDGNGQVSYLDGAGPFTVTYSNVEEGFTGIGNDDDNPDWVDPGAGDYRLMPGSPLVDAGESLYVLPDTFDVDGDGDTAEPTPDLDLARRVSSLSVDMGPYETPAADGLTVFNDPCVIYDSIGAGEQPFDGAETRTVQVTGSLSGQGGAALCVPSGASSVVFRVSSVNPLTEGNLRMVPSGATVSGGAGVVNYGAANGLNNANTVTIPVSSLGEVDIEANAGVIPGTTTPNTDPTTHVRLVTIGYYSPSVAPNLKFFPVNPCAVADSRPNKNAANGFEGANGFWGVGGAFPDIDVVGDFPSHQGGLNGVGNPDGNPTSCGVPASADAVLLNVVAVAPVNDSGFLSAGTGGTNPIPEAVTPFAPLNPGMANGAATIVNLSGQDKVAIDIDGNATAEVKVRVEVLGYYDDDPAGLDFTPVTPCTAFDSRPTKGATGIFAGLRLHGPLNSTVYKISGDIPVGQGKVDPVGPDLTTGNCGVPEDAEAVLMNFEAVNAEREGNFWVSAAGTSTTGGVLNFTELDPKMNNANTVVVPMDNLGRIKVEVNAGSFTPVDTPVAHARGIVFGYYE